MLLLLRPARVCGRALLSKHSAGSFARLLVSCHSLVGRQRARVPVAHRAGVRRSGSQVRRATLTGPCGRRSGWRMTGTGRAAAWMRTCSAACGQPRMCASLCRVRVELYSDLDADMFGSLWTAAHVCTPRCPRPCPSALRLGGCRKRRDARCAARLPAARLRRVACCLMGHAQSQARAVCRIWQQQQFWRGSWFVRRRPAVPAARWHCGPNAPCPGYNPTPGLQPGLQP